MKQTSLLYDKSLVKKFTPTVDELLNLFKHWVEMSVIRPSELAEILKINLERYGMLEHLDRFKTELKKVHQETSGEVNF